MSDPSIQTKNTSEARGQFRVIWPDGLGMRVSYAIAKLVQSSSSPFRIEFEGRTAHGDSMLELLAFGAEVDSKFMAIATGENAAEEMARFLAELPVKYFQVID